MDKKGEAKMSKFIDELGCLINKHSMENSSNTPDFILAQFINNCLDAFNAAVQQRETWYGRDARPSCSDNLPHDGLAMEVKHCGICNDKGYRWGDKTKICVCQGKPEVSVDEIMFMMSDSKYYDEYYGVREINHKRLAQAIHKRINGGGE